MIRLAVRVAQADAEIVLAELLELAPSGVEEVELDDGRVEYAVYGSAGELPALADVQAAAAGALLEVSSSELPDDWSERWQLFHRPVLIDSPAPALIPALRVRPPWETRNETSEAVEIVIDPGQAFGTGGHATTRLCLRLLLELAACDPHRGVLLDVGTGSGVLAIAAAKLGYAPVIGFDHDRESVRAASQNARANSVWIDIRRLDLRRETLPQAADISGVGAGDEASADPGMIPGVEARVGAGTVIVANLLRPLLEDLSKSLPSAPAHLLASGLLVEEVDGIVALYADGLGMGERERRHDGDWAAVWLQAQR